MTAWILACIGFMVTADKTTCLHIEQPLLLYNEVCVKSTVFQFILLSAYYAPGIILRGWGRVVKILLLVEIMSHLVGWEGWK